MYVCVFVGVIVCLLVHIQKKNSKKKKIEISYHGISWNRTLRKNKLGKL